MPSGILPAACQGEHGRDVAKMSMLLTRKLRDSLKVTSMPGLHGGLALTSPMDLSSRTVERRSFPWGDPDLSLFTTEGTVGSPV